MPGLFLIFLGFVIVAFPVLLVAFVAALLVLAGIVILTIAHKARQLEDKLGLQFNPGTYHKTFCGQPHRHFNRGPWY
ncbi:MAG: hypothetical protein JRD47_06650 [Deltaproteobacteria bacterium]|nr:hypothetical protein [Deltaproteobacteria bacterium]